MSLGVPGDVCTWWDVCNASSVVVVAGRGRVPFIPGTHPHPHPIPHTRSAATVPHLNRCCLSIVRAVMTRDCLPVP